MKQPNDIFDELEGMLLEEAKKFYSPKVIELYTDPQNYGELENPDGVTLHERYLWRHGGDIPRGRERHHRPNRLRNGRMRSHYCLRQRTDLHGQGETAGGCNEDIQRRSHRVPGRIT